MKLLLSGIFVSFVVAFALATAFASAALPCGTVSTSRGTMTTQAIAVSGTYVAPTDATGCDIGVYVPIGSTVTITATIHDANRFGVFNDGAMVTVTGSTIYNIGNHNSSLTFDPNGVQTGLGVFFAEGSSGSISSNTINNYQKGGIVVDGCNPSPGCTGTLTTSASIQDNVVTGLGPVHFIGQNGIQVSRGAVATSMTGNEVSDNIYDQNTFGADTPNHVGSSTGVVSTGILFFQAGGSPKTGKIASTNHAFRNQANVTVIN